MKIKSWLTVRIGVYLILLITYLAFNYYSPLRNTIFLTIPKSTSFSRVPDVYNKKNFGAVIKVGFAKRDITPPRFTWLAGYYPPHPSLIVNDKLWIKSLAFKDKNGSGFVIVSCDLIGLLNEKNRIASLVNTINKDSIFIIATHTHSGPDTIGLWGGKNKKYMSFLREQIASAIDESVNNLESGNIRFAESKLPGYTVGRVNNDPDDSVSVIQVLLSSGKPVTLVNYASHADVIKSFHISADFPYYLEQKLIKLIGGEVMFIPGAIGGVQPDIENNHDQFFVRTLGEALADKVYKSLDKPIVTKDISIKGKGLRLSVPLQNKKFIWAAKIGMISDFRNDQQFLVKVGAEYNSKAIIANPNGTIDVDFMRITMGPAEIITIPGELFPNIWSEVKREMSGDIKMLFGLTNGELGYFLSEEDFDSGEHKYHAGMSIGRTAGSSTRKALLSLAKD